VSASVMTAAPRGAPHLLLELHEHVRLGAAHLLPRRGLHHRHTVNLRGRLVLAQVETVVRRVLKEHKQEAKEGIALRESPNAELTLRTVIASLR
jgi:hypothetical protein